MVRLCCDGAEFSDAIDWLPGKDRVAVFKTSNRVLLRMKVIASGDDGRDAVEMLLSTVSCGLFCDVVFFFERGEDGSTFVGFSRGGMDFVIGDLPHEVSRWMTDEWFSRLSGVRVSCVGVELSSVAKEIDRHRVMRMADDVEHMTDSQFDDLMMTVSGALMSDVYTVKIELENMLPRSLIGGVIDVESEGVNGC